MKEGIGGTFMIYVLLVFLAVYIIFIAVAFNYARAFKVKNKVIDIIEQNEGITDYTDIGKNSVLGQIETYLGNVSYKINTFDEEKYCDTGAYVNKERGYCISSYSAGGDDITSTYYKVTTFVTIEFPFMNLAITVPVKGETRKIERINT